MALWQAWLSARAIVGQNQFLGGRCATDGEGIFQSTATGVSPAQDVTLRIQDGVVVVGGHRYVVATGAGQDGIGKARLQAVKVIILSQQLPFSIEEEQLGIVIFVEGTWEDPGHVHINVNAIAQTRKEGEYLGAVANQASRTPEPVCRLMVKAGIRAGIS
jgi:hypothetical protein